MNPIKTVFHNQVRQFLKERGMLVYYCFGIIVIGGVLPFIQSNFSSSLTCIIFLTFLFAKPLLADSIAMEREKKTLEPLLSTSLSGKHLFFGKLLFCMAFSMVHFLLCFTLLLLVSCFTKHSISLSPISWLLLISSILITFFVSSLIGIYISAKSADSHMAKNKANLPIYLLCLLLIVYLTILILQATLITFIVSIIFFGIHLLLVISFLCKVQHMKQWNFYDELIKKSNKVTHHSVSSNTIFHSQFYAILRHELKYLCSLKTLLINFLFLSITPTIVVCLMQYYTKSYNLKYAIVITTLMMPRISTNLIAYSVGGEKVYKTGESLLSTPLKIRSILLAKSFVPVLVSICMLALSSLFMVTLLPVYSYINQIGEPIPGYSFYQLLLLYPANILFGILMIFLTGSLSILSRTPRQGLYISSIVGFIFSLPTILILYLAPAPLVWTTLYLFLLLVAILCFLRKVSTHVSRPMIMSKL